MNPFAALPLTVTDLCNLHSVAAPPNGIAITLQIIHCTEG